MALWMHGHIFCAWVQLVDGISLCSFKTDKIEMQEQVGAQECIFQKPASEMGTRLMHYTGSMETVLVVQTQADRSLLGGRDCGTLLESWYTMC